MKTWIFQTKKLSPREERVIAEAKRKNRELREFLGAGLKKAFDKQLAKHKDKEEEIIRKLDAIISQKQNHGKKTNS